MPTTSCAHWRANPAPAKPFSKSCEIGSGANAHLDAHLRRVEDEWPTTATTETSAVEARRFVEHLGLGLQAALLVRHAPSAVADAFCASRLGGDRGAALGTLSSKVDFGAILAAFPN